MSFFSLNVNLPEPWAVGGEGPLSGHLPSPVSPGVLFFSQRLPKIPRPLAASLSGRGKWSGQRHREGLRGTCPFPVGQN